MYRIALNVAISFYRKEKKWLSKTTSFKEELIYNIKNEDEYNAELEDNIKLLEKFINQLDALNKALMLLYLEGQTYVDMGDILGITKTNVATKISRLKLKLKKEFLKHSNNGIN
jgi:RNA polymerase sigma-70 factor (ECF subfamily)